MALAARSASAAAPPDEVAKLIARIEAPQAASQSELSALGMEALLEQTQVPAVSIAVVWDFKLHWAKAYGVADAATGRRVDARTRFQAASISKPVTALAAMHLVQQRRLELDADINSILRSWKVPATVLTREQAVTPRSLLSHTSGADDGFGFPGYAPGAPLPSLVQILEGQLPSNVGKVVFKRTPYEAYKYSGGGYTLLQLALSERAGRPFSQFMGATVLAPLGMSDSSFEPLPTEATNVALAHDKQGQRMGVPWHVHPEQAAASLWSTPSDLAKLIIEIQTGLRGPRGKVIDQRTATEMTAPVGIGRYAMGLVIDRRQEGWYFSHSGSNWGYRAWLSGHLRKGYGVVIMTNGDNGMALMNEIADRVERAYQWDSWEGPAPN
ncbi:CubicO group peptidase (beta-lactamase class C family) [Inhella inkyongensis]|uniref:CubicO group peptidase (Beta-lactamase class C family) n=1 Tax=Inhella inkyongensis TaxID=392593 RepID=A0A840S8M1_9BURK|nr:serine hydrolase domain-containing protein [Inhella inkyongensis]MBB5205144.1 CubicO group peptidase (beta-lactamase class C family) [Inhella inkyongensis]